MRIAPLFILHDHPTIHVTAIYTIYKVPGHLSPTTSLPQDDNRSLSSAVSSAGFSTYADAKLALEATLASYPALNTGDDTKKFLETCLENLPSDGQVICQRMVPAATTMMNSAN